MAVGPGSGRSRYQKLADETRLTLQVCHYPRQVEMEQDRAPLVLSHHAELAGPTADEPLCGCRVDRRHHDQNRPHGPLRIGHQRLCQRHQSQRRRNGYPQYQRRRVPSGMELHYLAALPRRPNMKRLFRGIALATGSSNARMFFLLSIIRSALSRNCRAKLSRYSAMQRSVLLRRASRVQSRIARSNSLRVR